MNKLKITVILVIIILLISNVFFIFRYSFSQKELKETKQGLKAQQINEKILNFARLFINKVLRAEGEVSFEDRLQLENAVRDLQDSEILTQWQRFTESETEEVAQREVKDLLEIVIKKINY